MSIPLQRQPDPSEICREDDVEQHRERYLGAEGTLQCVGRFGLSAAQCQLRLLVETNWEDETVRVTPLASPSGCHKKALGDKVNERVNDRYL